MPCLRCGPSLAHRPSGIGRSDKGLRVWSKAAAKYARARLRDARLLQVAPHAAVRLEVCRTCPLRVTHRGTDYCGRPMWQRGVRDPLAQPGCGCPIRNKAEDPDEHCPLTSTSTNHACACRWCTAAAARPGPTPPPPAP
jgi:hypothetical protein